PFAVFSAHLTATSASAGAGSSNLQFEDQGGVVGEAGEALVVRVADNIGTRRQRIRHKGMVDAKTVAAGAEPGIFAELGVAPGPQIANPDLGDPVHVKCGAVDRARLVAVRAAGVEITDRENTADVLS